MVKEIIIPKENLVPRQEWLERNDTGISKEDGSLEVKAGGIGVSTGKYTGINTPLGELKINTEENCIIQ